MVHYLLKVTITIDATSNLPLQYEWYHNDLKVVGPKEPSLVLNCLTLDMDGTYSCRVFNDLKEVMSDVILNIIESI